MFYRPILSDICSPAHKPMFAAGVHLCYLAHEHIYIFFAFFFVTVVD